MRAGFALWVMVAVVMGCKAKTESPEFASPNATIETLFKAYDVDDVSQEEVRRRLQARERFKLFDEALFRQCFSDWQGDHDQGLGGFVFGQLVAAKDELTIQVEGDTARVKPGSGPSDLPPIVLIKQPTGWKIDLRQSVPPDIRQQLYEVYRRANRAERQAR